MGSSQCEGKVGATQGKLADVGSVLWSSLYLTFWLCSQSLQQGQIASLGGCDQRRWTGSHRPTAENQQTVLVWTPWRLSLLTNPWLHIADRIKASILGRQALGTWEVSRHSRPLYDPLLPKQDGKSPGFWLWDQMGSAMLWANGRNLPYFHPTQQLPHSDSYDISSQHLSLTPLALLERKGPSMGHSPHPPHPPRLR